MELILLRHGTTQGNLERRFIGTTDLPLIPQGEALARQVSQTLPAVEHIYHSPLLRCVQTARLLWPDTDMTPVDDLRETDFGPFEGKNHEELKDDPLYQQWITTADMSRLPVGESTADMIPRVTRGIRWILDDACRRGFSRVGVVAHGGTLMALMSQWGRPERPFYGWMCANCCGWRLSAEAEPLRLTVLEEIGGQT